MKKIFLVAALTASLVSGVESAAELFQRAVYAQDTLGDIDAAIPLYRRILTEAKDSRQLSGQALFRLGVCLARKGVAEGRQMLEKFVKDYPEMKDLVARARELAPGDFELQPEPWVDGELLTMILRLPAGLELGAFLYSAESTEVQGKRAWRLTTRRYTRQPGGISHVIADRETFRPVSSLFRHPAIGQFDTEYGQGGAVTKIKGQKEPKRTALDGVAYENDQIVYLLRRMPLKVGMKVDLPVMIPFSVGFMKIGMSIPAKETVQTPAGSFECFRVDFDIKQTFWISADANRYIVKYEGEGVQGELASIQRLERRQPAEFSHPEAGFSFKAPPGWIVLSFNRDNQGPNYAVHLLDPDMAGFHVVRIEPVPAGETVSEAGLRKQIEERLADRTKTLKNYSPRPVAWTPRTLNGRVGWSVIADFTEGGADMGEHYAWLQSASTRYIVMLRVEKSRLDEFTPHIDFILSSFSGR